MPPGAGVRVRGAPGMGGGNPFDVRSLDVSHAAVLVRPEETAALLYSLVRL